MYSMCYYLHINLLLADFQIFSENNNANSDSLVLRNQNTTLSTQHHASAGMKCLALFLEKIEPIGNK